MKAFMCDDQGCKKEYELDDFDSHTPMVVAKVFYGSLSVGTPFKQTSKRCNWWNTADDCYATNPKVFKSSGVDLAAHSVADIKLFKHKYDKISTEQNMTVLLFGSHTRRKLEYSSKRIFIQAQLWMIDIVSLSMLSPSMT